jgi:[ribosomal protein S18]-alanine N-acetyltransferase
MTHYTGNPLKISLAKEEERDWCAALMASTDPWITLGRGIEDCRKRCHDPEFLLFVAHEGDQPLGFILLQRRGVAGSPYIASIATAAECRGKGIGRLLLQFAEDYFRPDFKHIFLCVSSFNSRARELYERCGYQAIGELREYVIPGASEFLMHKRLREP